MATFSSSNNVTKTLTIERDPGTVPQWNEDMQKLYRFMCAPTNVAFWKDIPEITKRLSQLQHDEVCIRLANTPGIDLEANEQKFRQVLAACDARMDQIKQEKS